MKVRAIALLILMIGLFAGFFDVAEFAGFRNASWTRPFRLGLDLRGGTHLVYDADVSSLRPSEVGEAMKGLRDVIERRINFFGVTEPVVQTEETPGKHRLVVELAGVFDIKEAIKAIGETPFLEFREMSTTATDRVRSATTSQQLGVSDFVATPLTGRYLTRAALSSDQTTFAPIIALQFNDEGSKLFEEITARNVGKPLAIFLDGAPISSPTVREKITGGRAQITGQFTDTEAAQLVRRLNAGALPVHITLLSQQSVESSLGSEALARSLRAGIYGTLAVALFMIFWYRLPGIIAVLALGGVYAPLTLFVFKMFPVTLSAAGIAGFILSIGMAVDANILIFERMKEELRLEKSLDAAMLEGFRRAWTSIRDSNVSSLITAAILWIFGTSIVRGFALTLGFGIAISMFSAYTATRIFLQALPHRREGRLTHFLFGTGLR